MLRASGVPMAGLVVSTRVVCHTLVERRRRAERALTTAVETWSGTVASFPPSGHAAFTLAGIA